jgi:hypothetical protein
MCNTNRDPNKRKEKVNEEPIVNFKTMEIQKNENKRKAIVLAEPDVQAKNSKSPNNGDAGEEESSNSSKKTSPFILFGFIIDPNNRIKHAYSCNFCSRKFINPQALGGHQNCHKLERRLKQRIDDMKIDWINYSNGNSNGQMKIDCGSVSNVGASDVVDHDDKETREKEGSKIDLTLKL